MILSIGDEMHDVHITRSRRKTWEIRIGSEGTIHARGPLKMTDKRFMELLHTKLDWIEKKLEAVRMRPPAKPGRIFADGEFFPYMGRDYPLRLSLNPAKSRVSVILTEEEFVIVAPEQNPEIIQTALERWCRRVAGTMLPNRLRSIEARMGLKCQHITVKDQKKRWGSCSSRGNVNLNWRLLLMPPQVMDSVIIHELAHLVHPNHSKEYYRYLELHNPEYKAHGRWLKDHGRHLFF